MALARNHSTVHPLDTNHRVGGVVTEMTERDEYLEGIMAKIPSTEYLHRRLADYERNFPALQKQRDALLEALERIHPRHFSYEDCFTCAAIALARRGE